MGSNPYVNKFTSDQKRIGLLIKEVREARQLSYAQAARVSALGLSAIKRVENGQHASRGTLDRVAKGLQLPRSYHDALLVAHGYLPTPETWGTLVTMMALPRLRRQV
jgi:transcriptional regulator with XRE-family HTH domain